MFLFHQLIYLFDNAEIWNSLWWVFQSICSDLQLRKVWRHYLLQIHFLFGCSFTKYDSIVVYALTWSNYALVARVLKEDIKVLNPWFHFWFRYDLFNPKATFLCKSPCSENCLFYHKSLSLYWRCLMYVLWIHKSLDERWLDLLILISWYISSLSLSILLECKSFLEFHLDAEMKIVLLLVHLIQSTIFRV